MIFSGLMGLFYGFIFGALKIENQSGKGFDELFLKEEYLCIPIGVIIGGITGALNEYFRITVKNHLNSF